MVEIYVLGVGGIGSCASDGTLLKPSWPATPIDAYFTGRAGLSADTSAKPPPIGELYATHTTIPLQKRVAPRSTKSTFYFVAHVLAMDLQADYNLDIATEIPATSKFAPSPPTSFFTWATNIYECGATNTPTVAFGESTLNVRSCGKADFQVLHAAAEIDCEGTKWGLLGEVGKWVPVSAQRFSDVACIAGDENRNGIQTTVRGSVGEKIVVLFAQRPSNTPAQYGDAKVVSVACEIGASKQAIARSDTLECK